MAEDVIRGSVAVPKTLNRYGYCWSSPINFVDKDGMDGYYFYDPLTMESTEEQVNDDISRLESFYDTKVHKIPMDAGGDVAIDWSMMDDSKENIEVVVIYSHSSNNRLTVNPIKKDDGVKNDYWRRNDIMNLEQKKIDTLVMLGCNVGLTNSQNFTDGAINEEEKKNYIYSLAESFYVGNNANSIGRIIASDGSIYHGFSNGIHTMESKGKDKYLGITELLKACNVSNKE